MAEPQQAGELTTDGTITDVPVLLRTCPTCKAEFFVEAVSSHPAESGGAGRKKRYTLRCANGHEMTWVTGDAALSAPE